MAAFLTAGDLLALRFTVFQPLCICDWQQLLLAVAQQRKLWNYKHFTPAFSSVVLFLLLHTCMYTGYIHTYVVAAVVTRSSHLGVFLILLLFFTNLNRKELPNQQSKHNALMAPSTCMRQLLFSYLGQRCK